MLIHLKKTYPLIIFLLFTPMVIYATDFIAQKASGNITIDGIANEETWAEAIWYPMDQVWIPYGANVPASDFTGRFKLTWSDDKLYLLAEIIDDSLSDDHSNILDSYWEDDCLEIFIDEDASGGEHTNNFNAFAYHISTFYDAVDLNTKGMAEAFNDHVEVIMKKVNDSTYIWELALDVYDNGFTSTGNYSPVSLGNNKKMGFSLAYCDNDETTGRENFFASTEVPATNYNDHWQNASLFGNLTLVDSSMIDTSQTSIISSISSVSNTIVYPNPVEKGACVYFNPDNNSIQLIECYSISGKKLCRINGSALNSSILPKGQYIIRIIAQNGTKVERLIVR